MFNEAFDGLYGIVYDKFVISSYINETNLSGQTEDSTLTIHSHIINSLSVF